MLGDCCRERESVQLIGVRMLFCCASGVAFDAIAYATISSGDYSGVPWKYIKKKKYPSKVKATVRLFVFFWGCLQERELRLWFEGEVHMLCLFPCRTRCKVDHPGKYGEDWKCLMTNSLLEGFGSRYGSLVGCWLSKLCKLICVHFIIKIEGASATGNFPK